MKYVDVHCHLDFSDYDADRVEVLTRMKEKEIGAITIGTDFQSSKKAVEIAEANENAGPHDAVGQVWVCIGIHPEHLLEKPDNAVSELGNKDKALETTLSHFSFGGVFEELIKSPKVIGIGECGLEYFVMKKEETEKPQKELFAAQIEFAIKYDKPLMLHIRPSKGTQDAYLESLEILESYKNEAGNKLRGNVHFFAGGIPVAKKFLDLGFTMSFTGVITFTKDYDEIIKYLPVNSIMSETDAPFVAPVPFRGKRNEPGFVVEVVKKMAEIRGEDVDILSNSILENFRRVFRVKVPKS